MHHFYTLLQVGFIISLLLFEVACTLLPSPPRRVVNNYRITAALPQSHIVQKGDTLYKISQRYQIDMNMIAQLNKLTPPYVIYTGQQLQLTNTASSIPTTLPVDPRPTKPSKPTTTVPSPVISRSTPKKQLPSLVVKPTVISAPSATQQQRCTPMINWQWPATGAIRENVTINGKRGLEILGYTGQPIKASASGQVVYSGDGLNGYRNLIIIQHNGAFLSTYSNNRTRLVREGNYVTAGQVIAEMGVNTDYQANLHFEIRCYTKTLDPLPYLPK